jgi:hypothetical protein
VLVRVLALIVEDVGLERRNDRRRYNLFKMQFGLRPLVPVGARI